MAANYFSVKQVGGYNPQSQGGFVGPQLQPAATVQRVQPAVAPARQTTVTKPKLTFYRDEGSATVYDNTGRRYSDPKSFLAAGGNWNTIIVKPAIKVAPVPVAPPLKVAPVQNVGTITKVTGASPNQPKKKQSFGSALLDAFNNRNSVYKDVATKAIDKALPKFKVTPFDPNSFQIKVGEGLSPEQAAIAFQVTGGSPTPRTPAQQRADMASFISGSSTSDLLKRQFGDNKLTKTLGFVTDQVDPVIRDVADIRLTNRVAEEVNRGTIDKSVLDGIQVLQKTNLQVVGDVAQAVLTAYTPSVGVGLVKSSVGKNLVTEGLTQLAKQGAKEGLSAGLQFGVAQALSSGSTDVNEIAKIIMINAGIGVGAGGVLSTAIPASVQAYAKIIAGNNRIRAGRVSGFMKQGYSKAEATKLATQGGYLGGVPDKPKPSLIEEARKHKSAEDWVETIRKALPEGPGETKRLETIKQLEEIAGEKEGWLDSAHNVYEKAFKTDPLLTEAKKYKSAEEFVKNTEVDMPLSKLSPMLERSVIESTPSKSKGAIEVIMNRGNKEDLVIVDGLHRYYEALDRGDKTIKIKFDFKNSPTKSQLTDIWKKASQAKASESFRANLPKYEAATKEINDRARAVAGGNRVLPAPVKGEERAVFKIVNEYGGDITQLKDAARNTIVITNPKEIPNILKKYKDGRIKGSMDTPTPLGYKGVIIHVPTKAGVIGETQLASPEMIYGKAASEAEAVMQLGQDVVNQIKKTSGVPPAQGHVYYEKWRDLEPKVLSGTVSPAELRKFKALEKQSNDYHSRLSAAEAKRLASSSVTTLPKAAALAKPSPLGTKPLPGSNREIKAPPSSVGSTLNKKSSPSMKVNLSNTDIDVPFNKSIPQKKAQVNERGFATSVKKVVPEAKFESNKTVRNREQLAIRAKNLVKENIDAAERMAARPTDEGVAVTSELIKHYKDLAGKAKTTAEKNLALDKIGVLANETARNLTAMGRGVEAAKILNMQTPEGQLRFASRLIQKYNEMVENNPGLLGLRKKIPDLTKEEYRELYNEAARIFAMPEGEAKAIAFQKFQNNKILGRIPSRFANKVISVWKAGLLTGLKTTGINVSANISHTTSEIIKDVPAVVVDKIISVFSGKRTMALTMRGNPKGVAEGWKKGLRYLKTGYDERNIAQKLDYKKVNFKSKGGKILQKYEEAIFRLIGAEDQPFYYGAKSRSMYSQAIAQAKNKGLKGTERVAFVDNLVANPTDDILKYAVHDAEIAVFQNQTLLGEGAKWVQKKWPGQLIVPFGRTPASVATQIINYSPVGIVKTIAQNIGKGKFDQRLFAQGIGRGITGTGAMYIGMELFKANKISLGYPKSEREQRLWELEGRKPNSILINGKWRSISVLGPLGNTLVLGGYLQNGLNETGSLTQAMAISGAGAAKSLTEQTFLQGLNSFLNAVDDPGGYGPGLLARLAGSVVPTIVSDVAQATDPLQRRASATKDGMLTPIQARLPYFRNKLEPKINAVGEQVKRPGNPIETLIDPTRPSRMQDSTVIRELRRLHDMGYFATPTYFADEKKLGLSGREKTLLQEEAGKLFREKVEIVFKNQKDYIEKTDEEKSKIIIDFAEKARVQAKKNFVGNKLEEIKAAAESDKGFIPLIANYAKAFSVDPSSAFKTLITSEQLDKVVNDAVVMKRLSMDESQAIKRKLEATKDMKLDHTIPIQLGGDNSEENLKLVPTEVHANYSLVENKLGRMLRDGEISRNDAQKLIRDFKEGRISADSILNK